MNRTFVGAIVVWPLIALLTVGLFFFVLKTPKDIGIYTGWIPSLIFIILTMFLSLYFLIPLALVLAIYAAATALRIDKNKKIKEREEQIREREEKRLKEIDKMSINDL